MPVRKKIIIGALAAVLCGAFLFFFSRPKTVAWNAAEGKEAPKESAIADILNIFPNGSEKPKEPEKAKEVVIDPSLKLQNPPSSIKAIYMTAWSATSASRIDSLIDVAEKTSVNAIVIDIKDYSGKIAYATHDPEIEKYATEEIKIRDIGALIRKLHEKNIYVIARVTVFQDPALASSRPDLAIKDSSTGKVWVDNKKLAWVDSSSKEVWDYNIRVAKNAFSKGFDEVNFDYVRFPSDGSLNAMSYPFYDKTRSKSEVMKDFFVYLRENLKGEKISADLFGLTTSAADDLGIGQVLTDAIVNFDAVCPMVYPSHFANGFIGYKNPAAYPYEVIKYSMESAVKKVGPEYAGRLRPWLQDFDLGANYGPAEVSAEIKAAEETSGGWMIWAPSNVYTVSGIPKEDAAGDKKTE